MVRRRFFPVVLVLLGLLSSCTSPESDLPDGPSLVAASAAALDGLHTVRFRLSVTGVVPGLDVNEVDGQATRDQGPNGAAQGQADVQEPADRFTAGYTLVGDRLYLTDKHGVRRTAPVDPGFTPAAMLDPQRGLRRLLTGATNVRSERSESLDKVDTYRVGGKVGRDVISALVPGIRSDVDVKFWVRRDGDHELMRIWMQVPAQERTAGATWLELALSEHNAPLTIAAPPS
jgi:lipoprotein LprG